MEFHASMVRCQRPENDEPAVRPASKSSICASFSPEVGPKKSPTHIANSNFPYFASRVLTFSNRELMFPSAGPTTMLMSMLSMALCIIYQFAHIFRGAAIAVECKCKTRPCLPLVWQAWHALGPNCICVRSQTARRLVGMSLGVAPAVLVAVQDVVTHENEHVVDTTEGASDDKLAETWVPLEFTHAGKAYKLDLADSDRFAFRI